MQTTPRPIEHSSTPYLARPSLAYFEVQEVDQVWDLVSPLLQKAIDRSYGETTLRDEYEKLKRKETTLWMVHIAGRPLAAAITYFHVYPRKKYLVIALMGGERMDLWEHFQADVAALAKTWGASGMQAEVRPGLVRKLSGHGWKKVRTIIRKDF